MTTKRSEKKLPLARRAMQTAHDYEVCAKRLKALADSDRLQIVNSLLRGPKNVSELADALGVAMVKVSHHLRVLRNAQVVQTTKQGKFVIYRLNPDVSSNGQSPSNLKTIDLGCCRLDLFQAIGHR